jgi:tRNA G18 (ribose-2'-O)-methylase SpoU
VPIEVTEADDPRLADYRELQALGHRPDPRRFIAESELAVERLLRSRFGVRSVLGTESHLQRLAPALADRPEVCVLVAEQPVIRDAVGFNFHRGVAACGLRPDGLAWGDLSEGPDDDERTLDAWAGVFARPRFRVLVAQGLVDPANVGSIVRSARAFGVDLVLLDRRGADPLSRRAIRAAIGNVFAQPIAGVGDLGAALAGLRRRGARVLAATLGPRARPLPEVAPPERLALLLGSEGTGLPAELCAAADAEVTIPIVPDVDSLGVAAAASVLLYALADRRAAGI